MTMCHSMNDNFSFTTWQLSYKTFKKIPTKGYDKLITFHHCSVKPELGYVFNLW